MLIARSYSAGEIGCFVTTFQMSKYLVVLSRAFGLTFDQYSKELGSY